LFKKAPEEGVPPPSASSVIPPGKQPILKDYGMDPEHRKFVFAEEYTAKSEKSMKDEFNKEDRELGIRRKTSTGKGRFHEDKRRLGNTNYECALCFRVSSTFSSHTHTNPKYSLLSPFHTRNPPKTNTINNLRLF